MVRLLLILFLSEGQLCSTIICVDLYMHCSISVFVNCPNCIFQLYFSAAFLNCIFQLHFISKSALQNTELEAVYCWLSTGASDTSRFERGMSTSRSKKRGFLDWSNPMSEIRRVSTQNETTSYVQWRLFHQPYLEGGPNVNCLPPQEVVVVAQNSSC